MRWRLQGAWNSRLAAVCDVVSHSIYTTAAAASTAVAIEAQYHLMSWKYTFFELISINKTISQKQSINQLNWWSICHKLITIILSRINLYFFFLFYFKSHRISQNRTNSLSLPFPSQIRVRKKTHFEIELKIVHRKKKWSWVI